MDDWTLSPSYPELPKVSAVDITDANKQTEAFVPNLAQSLFPLSGHDVSDIKQLEFNHKYIHNYMEQNNCYPSFCSNYCLASKFFRSPKPFFHRLYEGSFTY